MTALHPQPLLRVSGIHKRYGHQVALHDAIF